MFAVGSDGAPQNAEQAEAMWQIGCDRGVGQACAQLAHTAFDRNDLARALLYASRACVGGAVRGCTELGVLAFLGQGTRPSLDRAESLWRHACAAGEDEACSYLAMVGLRRKDGRAARHWLKDCDAEHHAGCTGLGLLREHGIGGPRDFRGALAAYIEGCHAGEPSACVFGGVLIEESSVAHRHHRRAVRLYEIGCEAPASELCWIEEGDAERWRVHYAGEGFTRRSCVGHTARALACYNAGLGHERGAAGSIDAERAQGLLDEGCRQGLERACRKVDAIIVQ